MTRGSLASRMDNIDRDDHTNDGHPDDDQMTKAFEGFLKNQDFRIPREKGKTFMETACETLGSRLIMSQAVSFAARSIPKPFFRKENDSILVCKPIRKVYGNLYEPNSCRLVESFAVLLLETHSPQSLRGQMYLPTKGRPLSLEESTYTPAPSGFIWVLPGAPSLRKI